MAKRHSKVVKFYDGTQYPLGVGINFTVSATYWASISDALLTINSLKDISCSVDAICLTTHFSMLR